MDPFTLVVVLLCTVASAFGNDNVAKPDPFTLVISSNDTNDHDDIYVTPAHFFIGKSNGDILRCLFENPSVCETFYSYNSTTGVTSIVLRGEYLYASADENILKCDLYEKSCTKFKSFESNVIALSISIGYPSSISYIYVALTQGRLMRCELSNPESCSLYRPFRTEIKSLVVADKFMYIGLGSKKIWRCSMAVESPYGCGFIYAAASEVRGIIAYQDTAIFVSEDGTFYNYTMSRDDVCTHGAYKTSPGARFKSIAAFDRSLYALHDSTIVVCEWGTLGNCSNYSDYEGALSISFAYRTHRMQKRYIGEDKTCVSPCPPHVPYYDISQRPKYEVFTDGGKIYQFLAGLPGFYVSSRRSNQAVIFAMGADGQILVSDWTSRESRSLGTSSMFAGRPVAGAGEMIAEDGVIKSIRACSCQYRTTVELNQQVINALYLRGYTGKIESLPCGEDACYQIARGQ